MSDQHDKSKISFFDNHFLNVDFSINIVGTNFKFCFPILYNPFVKTLVTFVKL